MSIDEKLIKMCRILLYSTAVLPLVLWAGFTFPYVTIRTVFFRVIIEIIGLMLLWLWMHGKVQFSAFKRAYFFWIFLGLLIIESIAALFGESPLASFFGDLERMWGIFTVAHIFLFYILARILFEKKQWHVFFNVSLATSILVSIYGILQRNPGSFGVYLFGAGVGTRIVSTLGNPVYVAIYLLFNIAFALYLLMHEKSPKLRYFYIATIAIDFYAFTLTDIRGAYLGLIMGASFAALAYIFLGRKKRYRQLIGAGFILGIIILGLGFQFRKTELVRQIPVLRRVATISINDETAKTRFIGWNAAIQGFKKDPLTGVGMENYNILFNEYFPANYYLLAPTETYFDRAHNQFFNILSESGIFALLLYLCFPIYIGYYLIRGYRNKKFSLNEFLLFSGMTIAYFVHLFFVFDDFHSLLFFMVLLALIENQYYDGTIIAYQTNKDAQHKKILPVAIIIIMVPLVMYSIFNLNYKVLRASEDTGKAYLSNDIAFSLSHYRAALNENLITSENLTLNFAEFLMGLTSTENIEKIKNDSILRADVLNAFLEAKDSLDNEIKKKPNDAVFYLKLGQLYNSQYLIDDDISHLQGAISQLEKARELSSERIQIYLILGETYVLAGESEKAVEVLEQAVALEPAFKATYYYLGRALLTNGELLKAYDSIVNKAFIERKYVPEESMIAFVLAEELGVAGEYDKMITVYEYLVKFKPTDARVRSALAIAYVLADRYEDAIFAAQKATELDPSFAQEAAAVIQAIQDGRIDELKASAF